MAPTMARLNRAGERPRSSVARASGRGGAKGIRVTDETELDAALREALAHEGPALVEVMTDPALI